MILTLPLGIRMLPSGEERIVRAQVHGMPGDDPDLPLRWLELERGGETLSVAVGPVEVGGPDEELWEFLLEIR